MASLTLTSLPHYTLAALLVYEFLALFGWRFCNGLEQMNGSVLVPPSRAAHKEKGQFVPGSGRFCWTQETDEQLDGNNPTCYNTCMMDVEIFATRQEMGVAAAKATADFLRLSLSQQKTVRAVFAAAPSQNEMLAALVKTEGIDWQRVEAFHMDEYIGLDVTAPQRFARFLKDRLFDRLPFRAVHLIESEIPDAVKKYEKLLQATPIDLVCLGIGENGHIAFNDPPVADFADPAWVKVVELDEMCRQQQVNDGCFATFNDVPRQAMTLTIPALLSGRRLICTVPGQTKRQAVFKTLHDPISTECPSTILRNHASCTLFLDRESAGEWWANRKGTVFENRVKED